MEYSDKLHFLSDLPWYYAGTIIVAFFMLLSVGILWVTHQIFSSQTLKSSHDVAGYTFGIIGVIYGVLLGFTVVEANNHFHEAEENIIHEAALLSELFRDATVFPEAKQIRKVIHDYAVSVHDKEWQMMASQQESEEARGLYDQIWNTYTKLNPTTDKEKIWYQESLSKLNDLSMQRINRLFAMERSFGSLMWTLLIAGGIVTISFMCFFYADNQIAQSLMTVLLSGTIAFMLFLIMSLEGVYAGDVRVMATPLERVIQRFDAVVGTPVK
jgi:hypothetical protein